MLQSWLVVLISLAYLGALFGIAYYGDQRARRIQPRSRPIVYSLALAVHCTSWGFFGAVGQAATFGWAAAPPLGTALLVVPSYIVPIVLYLLGWRFWEKLVRVGKQQKITSIADFISSRHGKSQSLAALVAVIAVIGIVPYVALQLKSVSITYQIVSGGAVSAGNTPLWQDTALYIALLMGLFAVLFGTRRIDATEHNQGMMLAVAFESLVKLAAGLAVGAFVTWGMFDGLDDLAARLQQAVPAAGAAHPGYLGAFVTQMFLGGAVAFTLPRLFHVNVVENTNPRDVLTARWMYPLYLLLFGAFVWPVAAAGMIYFGAGTDADTYMLTLPMAAEQPALAMFVFIGGLSAGTSMVIVASVALSIMVCNDVIMPLLLRSRRLRLNERKDLSSLLLLIRRCAITVLMLLAYGYYRLTADFVALAAFGVIAFVAVAQFAPAVVGGLYWKQGSRQGVMIGMSLGFLLWLYTLLLPMLIDAGLLPRSLLTVGPMGIDWLRPVALLGLEGLDRATHGAVWSLSVNLACYVLFSLRDRRRLLERVQAAAFVDPPHQRLDTGEAITRGNTTIGDLQVLAERFLGKARADEIFSAYGRQQGRWLLPGERADAELVQQVERLMAAVIGASSARVVLDSALHGRKMQLEEVANIVGEASQVLQFNRELLQVTFESVSQGIIVVDSELRLVAWNQRYADMFDYPEGFLRVGKRIAEMVRYNVERGEYGPVSNEHELSLYVNAGLTPFRQDRPYVVERRRPNGTVIEIHGNPMPGGGFVTTYSDITEHKRTEQALRESEQNIRVYTDNVPALIAYIDKDRRFRFVNRTYETLFGVQREEIYGQRVDEVLNETSMRHRWPYMEAVLAGKPQRFQVELGGADGGFRHVSATYIPDLSDSGEVLGFFALFHDITDRVMAERALQEAKASLERRVEERTQELMAANEALQAAKHEAEQANLSKTRFLAAASHDLLQPLNAAGLFCSALSHRLTSAEDAHLAGNIEAALKSAEGLLSELLDISKLDAGALKPQPAQFDLGELMAELAVEFSVLARRKGLELRVVPCRQMVRSDRQLLRRVLQNFLSNAIRYTREGRVMLGCRWQGDQLRAEVWDTGAGIPPDQLLKIFEEFHRLDHHDTQGDKCLGLGLAIADRIGRMLGHEISVRSWLGRGSVFAVAIPRTGARPAPVVAPVKPAAAGGLAGMRVLCVDNEPSIVQGMAALLGGWGCEVITAADLAEAEAALAADPRLDVMLADYRLDGGRTGIELMDAIQARLGRTLPGVIIIADHGESIREAVASRGYRFMNKPVKPAALRALLGQMRPRRRA